MTPMEDLAWVRERSECSLAAVFELLRQQVKRDVDDRKELSKPISDFQGRPGYAYGLSITEGQDSFTVLLEPQRSPKNRPMVIT